MAVIKKPDNQPLRLDSNMALPARFVPSFRVVHASENGCRNSLLLRMHGGLGDVICAEPSVRYAVKHFKEVEISLASLYVGLFQHIPFKKVYGPHNVAELDITKYLLYENTDTSNELAAEFICHTIMHGIDYASLYMWRTILPMNEREIILIPTEAEQATAANLINPETDIVLHPGKTWQTRTFPKNWWDTVISHIVGQGYRPVIIGGTVDQGRASTVDVDTTGALDLRYKLSLMETVAVLQRARVLLTNDSSPLHMATTGDAWIGFVSTVKHPDHLYTYRTPTRLKGIPGDYKGIWAWRMQDLARGGIYQGLDVCPNKDRTIRVDNCDVVDLLKWIPDAVDFANWGISKLVSPGDT